MKSTELYLIERAINKIYPFIVGVEFHEFDEDDDLVVYLKISVSKFREAYPNYHYGLKFREGGKHASFWTFIQHNNKYDDEIDDMRNLHNDIFELIDRIRNKFIPHSIKHGEVLLISHLKLVA